MPLKSASQQFVLKVSNDFNLNSAKSYQFYRSEWELLDVEETNKSNSIDQVSLKYLIYRGLYMLLLLSSITFSTSCQSHLFHIFLTNWSFTAQNLYAVLFFTNVFWRWWSINEKKRKSERDICNIELGNAPMMKITTGKSDSNSNSSGNLVYLDYPLEAHQSDCCSARSSKQIHKEDGNNEQTELTYLEKAIWILMNIVHVLPYCVVLGYWVVVYKYDPEQPFCEKFRSHYIVHGATAVLAFVDTLVIAVPARVTHFLIPCGLLIFYVVFTYFYELGGGEYRNGKEFIYSVLDWKNKPSKAFIFSTMGILLSPLAHTVFCWGIHKFRMCLVTFHKRNKNKT